MTLCDCDEPDIYTKPTRWRVVVELAVPISDKRNTSGRPYFLKMFRTVSNLDYSSISNLEKRRSVASDPNKNLRVERGPAEETGLLERLFFLTSRWLWSSGPPHRQTCFAKAIALTLLVAGVLSVLSFCAQFFFDWDVFNVDLHFFMDPTSFLCFLSWWLQCQPTADSHPHGVFCCTTVVAWLGLFLPRYSKLYLSNHFFWHFCLKQNQTLFHSALLWSSYISVCILSRTTEISVYHCRFIDFRRKRPK